MNKNTLLLLIEGIKILFTFCSSSPLAFPGDNDFDSSNWGQWTSKGFGLKQTSGWRDGPLKDHTSEIRGSSYKSKSGNHAI